MLANSKSGGGNHYDGGKRRLILCPRVFEGSVHHVMGVPPEGGSRYAF